MRRLKEINIWGCTKRQIIINLVDKIKGQAKAYKISNDSLSAKVEIFEDVPEYLDFIEILQNEDVKFFISETRVYTAYEWEHADYFFMKLYWPWKSQLKTSEEFGTQYLFENYCEECGRDRRQKSELFVPTIKASHYDICSSMPEIVVNKKVIDLIQKHSLTGCQLSTVKDSRTKANSDLKQLLITNQLSHMNSATCLQIEKCDVCHRISRYPYKELIYNHKDLEKACDFNLTFESTSVEPVHNRFIIQHYTVVSAKVWRLFKKEEVKKVVFEPISIC